MEPWASHKVGTAPWDPPLPHLILALGTTSVSSERIGSPTCQGFIDPQPSQTQMNGVPDTQ